MYKFKDIFTLNLNTRGGVKLFNKIANKYNLHKEDRKDLMNLEVGSAVNKNDNSFYIRFSDDCNADFKAVLFYYCHVISYTIAAYNAITYHSAISFVEENPLYVVQVQIFKNKHIIRGMNGDRIQSINSYEDFINILNNMAGEENIDFKHYYQEITAEQYWSNYK